MFSWTQSPKEKKATFCIYKGSIRISYFDDLHEAELRKSIKQYEGKPIRNIYIEMKRVSPVFGTLTTDMLNISGRVGINFRGLLDENSKEGLRIMGKIISQSNHVRRLFFKFSVTAELFLRPLRSLNNLTELRILDHLVNPKQEIKVVLILARMNLNRVKVSLHSIRASNLNILHERLSPKQFDKILLDYINCIRDAHMWRDVLSFFSQKPLPYLFLDSRPYHFLYLKRRGFPMPETATIEYHVAHVKRVLDMFIRSEAIERSSVLEDYVEGMKNRIPIMRKLVRAFLNVGTFSIFIRLETGRNLEVRVGEYDTVLGLKKMIEERVGTPATKMNLKRCGYILKDHITMIEYNIERKSTLRLVSTHQQTSSMIHYLTDWIDYLF